MGPNLIRVEPLGIEISRPILFAALLLAAAGLYLGLVKLIRFYVIYGIVMKFHGGDANIVHYVFVWRVLLWPAYVLASAVVVAPLYLLTGHVLISGRFDVRPLCKFIYQNGFRLCVIAILLGVVQWSVEWAALALARGARPILEWLGGPPRGWKGLLVWDIFQPPFSAPIFFVRAIMPAVTVAIVLKGRQALASADRLD